MLAWAAEHGNPERVVDAGTGSGRFLLEAGRRFPDAALVGVELDPLAANIARGNLAAAGFDRRSEIIVANYLDARLPRIGGRTLYIGNPPYIRHHLIDGHWKDWFVEGAKKLGLKASKLAGLHVYFFLATALRADTGDYGAFITSAEWLDVNYGRVLRELLLDRLGGRSIVVIDQTARPFPNAATTAAITTFGIGDKPAEVHLRRVRDLDEIGAYTIGLGIPHARLQSENRWSRLSNGKRPRLAGYVELGEICRVHRGQVTGANRFWIAGPHSRNLPESVLFPCVTRARDLFDANGVICDSAKLRSIIDLPSDLDVFNDVERESVKRFLEQAQAQGVHLGYIARTRRVWWSVGLREPAPILCSYMARRPPAFALNSVGARHINIAHGLYPRQSLSEGALNTLVSYLRRTTSS